jgi:hypothetical protein
MRVSLAFEANAPSFAALRSSLAQRSHRLM